MAGRIMSAGLSARKRTDEGRFNPVTGVRIRLVVFGV
jgi:hypothetical protein